MPPQPTPRRLATAAPTALVGAVALLIMPLGGCGSPIGMGCMAGTLMGASVVGVSAVATANRKVDLPTALVGGALIGVASGCVAASVAASLARKREQRAQQLRDAAAAPSIKPPPVAAAPPGPPPFTGTLEASTSPNGQALVRATFELPTASVVLNAAPSSDPDHVWLRIRDTSSSSVPKVCTLHLSADSESHIANESHVEIQNGEATLRGNVALSFLAAMVTADHASLHACGKVWPLSAVSKAFLGRFVERVGELTPPPETPYPSPSPKPGPNPRPRPRPRP